MKYSMKQEKDGTSLCSYVQTQYGRKYNMSFLSKRLRSE